jgi:xylulokinase
MIPEGALFIGLDSSTQGIKLQVLENRNGELCLSASYRVNYDTDLPKYKTHGGVYRDGTTVTANPLMWIEALELVFQRAAQTDLSKVVAISGSGQQHASVYWRKGALDVLRGLTGDSPLAQQLEHCFTTYNSPVWMDSSTTALCNELQNTLGGSQKVAELTGSRAFERFTLPQIAKVRYICYNRICGSYPLSLN